MNSRPVTNDGTPSPNTFPQQWDEHETRINGYNKDLLNSCKLSSWVSGIVGVVVAGLCGWVLLTVHQQGKDIVEVKTHNVHMTKSIDTLQQDFTTRFDKVEKGLEQHSERLYLESRRTQDKLDALIMQKKL